ncbi:MAG: hypothetical protein JWM71_1767, partial [Solirubrobacteraceae bacterium]|nr:hypothetical protein [Solirubrobacteraceae bacterium]
GVFCDLTTERPHRPALSTADALAELRCSAGSQFDPTIVEELGAVLGEVPAARRFSRQLAVAV